MNDVLAVDGSVTSNTLDLSKVDLSGSTTVTVDVVVTDLTTGCSKRTNVNDGSSLVLTINRLEGSNNITTNQVSYCTGEDPKIIIGNANPTSSQGAIITYKWQERTPAESTVWEDILNSDSPDFNPPPTIGVGIHEFRRLVTSTLGTATCSPTSDLYYSNTVTLTVGGDAGITPEVTLTTNIGAGGNTVCDNTNILFTATASPSVRWYEFIIDGASQGFQASPTNTFNSASSTVTFTGSVNVKVKVYTGVSTGTGCVGEDEFLVNVNSQSNPNLIQYNGTNNLCNGETPDSPIEGASNPVSDLSGLGGVIQYKWQYNNGGGWFDINPSNSANFTPGPLFTSTSYRRISKSLYNGSLCPVDNSLIASNVVTITVDAAPTPSAVLSSGLSSNTMCSGTNSITLDASSSTDGTSYLFFHNGVPAISQPSASSSFTTTATILDGHIFKVRVYSGANRTGCFDEAQFTVSINSISGVNEIGPNTQTVCDITEIQMLSSAQPAPTGSGPISYQWEIRPVATGNWAPIDGATSETLTPTLSGVSSAFRRQVISTLNGVNCTVYSNIVTVTTSTSTVSAQIDSDMPSHTVCASDTGDITFTATEDPSAALYVFYINGEQVQSDAASRTYSHSISSFTGNATVTLRVINNLGCFDEDQLIVKLNSLSPGVISGTTTVCENSSDIIVLSNVTSGTINGLTASNGDYQWQYSDDNNNWSDIIINGNNATFNVPTVPAPPERYYRRLVKNTLNTVTCTLFSNTVKISVSSAPTAILSNDKTGVSSSVSVCDGESLIFTGSGGKSFQFYVGGDLRLTTNSNSGPASANFNPADFGGVADGDQVTVKVYNKVLDGGNPDSTACSSISSPVTVSIDPIPGTTISSDKLNDIICDDESFKITATAGGITGAVYEFSVNGVFTDIITATSTGTSVEFSPTAPFTNSILISVKVTTPSGCSSTSSLTMIENIINSPGTITGTQSVCFNSQPTQLSNATTATTLSGSATVTYQWQSSPIANFSSSVTTIIGATSESYTPDPLSQTTYFRRLAFSDLNGKTCSSTTDIVEVEVRDGPGGTLLLNGQNVGSETLCPDQDLILSVTGIADVANKSFEYRRGGVVINTSSSTSFVVPNPSGTASYSVYVYDMPLLGAGINPAACRSLTNSIVITIADEEDVQLNVTGAINNTFCNGDNVVFTVPAPAGTNYEFKLNNQPLQNGPSFTTSSTNITNNSVVSVIVTLANGCTASTSVTLIENIIDSPGTITGTQSICFNGQPTQLSNATTASATNASATITYQWQSSPNANFSADVTNIPGADNPDYTPGLLSETTYFRRVLYQNLT